MPKYTFECPTCSTRFDRTLKMGEHPTHPCPSCSNEAPRLFEGSAFGFGFAEPIKKSAPANTGVHSMDYPSADMIVGRSAEARWGTYRARDEVKKKVRQDGGNSALSRVDGEGFVEYEAMNSTTLEARGKLVDYAVDVEKRTELSPGH